MKIRPAVIDYLLVFAASCVITIAIWPKSEARQILSLQTPDGQWQMRSLALSDPDLQIIDAKLKAIEEHNRSPEVAVAAWKEELTEFYKNSQPEETNSRPAESETLGDGATTASISDDVVTASYEQVEKAQSDQAVSPRQEDVSSQETIQVAAAEIPESAFPVELKGIVPPQKPSLAYQMAFLIGVLMACVYKHWLGWAPDQPGRKTQPLRVRMRRYSLASGASLSLLAALLLITG